MRRKRVPWTEGAVFFSHSNLEINLAPEGRDHVYGRHDQNELPTILEHVSKPGLVDATLARASIRRCTRGESASPRTVGSLRLV